MFNFHSGMIDAILDGYRLHPMGIHGLPHWARVLENGLRLAEYTGVNPEVVALFAVLHDARRENDCHDPEHGRRGSELAAVLRDKHFRLPDEDFKRLQYACEQHTNGLNDSDVDIQTCWDADRLDLWRVGITPRYDMLGLEAQKENIFKWAKERSLDGHMPEYVTEQWMKMD